MKPPFSPPAHMGKHKSASDSFGTFLALMRTLEIVLMNRADFCKRQMENLEGKLSLYCSEALEMSTKRSSFHALITQKSDLVSAEIEQYFSKPNKNSGAVKDLNEQAKLMKEKVGVVIDCVYRAPPISNSSNSSPDLCGDFFEIFQLLENSIDCLDTFNRHMDLRLKEIGELISNFTKASLMISSIIDSLSTDHNNNETHGS